ncbi:hypothetical protein BC833DRAFT_572719 [Globomyces pollinis-pini]|nr:hypothetical protein BC833DRAFT_572719 [Globomyces pollinis-pini]
MTFPTVDSRRRPGTEQIDYFHYPLDPMDLHSCWKKATVDSKSKTKEMAMHGKRRENATWRRYMQVHYHLPKLNPKELNWSKDSDRCWFYGPFYGNHKNTEPDSQSNRDNDSQDESPVKNNLKSVLKNKKNPKDFIPAIITNKNTLRKTASDTALFDQRKNPLERPFVKDVSPDLAITPKDIVKEFFGCDSSNSSPRSSTNSPSKRLRFHGEIGIRISVTRETSDQDLFFSAEDISQESSSQVIIDYKESIKLTEDDDISQELEEETLNKMIHDSNTILGILADRSSTTAAPAPPSERSEDENSDSSATLMDSEVKIVEEPPAPVRRRTSIVIGYRPYPKVPFPRVGRVVTVSESPMLKQMRNDLEYQRDTTFVYEPDMIPDNDDESPSERPVKQWPEPPVEGSYGFVDYIKDTVVNTYAITSLVYSGLKHLRIW